jgi:hypothetical protein
VGVESDRLVFDYLSKVGDLAQTALPAAERMRLVAQLRQDIESQRGETDSPAAVERILGRIGTPDAVVEAAAGSGGGAGRARDAAAEEPPAGPPPPGSYGPHARTRGLRKDTADVPPPRGGRAGRDSDEADWWGTGGGLGGGVFGDEVPGLPGMTGGVFIPFGDEELGDGGQAREPRGKDEAEAEPVAEPVAEPAPAKRGGGLPRLLRGAAGAGLRGWGSPVLLISAALLVAGAAIGSFVPLGLGWLGAYLTRALSRTQAKIAVFGIPGAAAAGLLVWLWGRDAGKWGSRVPSGQLGRAILDGVPFTVRAAALASAAYLLLRARRSAG